MKLATFVKDGRQSWGIVINNARDGKDWVYEPEKAIYAVKRITNGTNGYFRCLPEYMKSFVWPKTLKEFLEMGDEAMETLKKLEGFLIRYNEQSDPYFLSCVGYPIDEVRLRCPIPDSKLFLGLVQNSPSFFRVNPARTHVNILPQAHQRPMTGIVGHGETRMGAPGGNVEVGLVIGKEAYNVPIEEAYDYLAGYVVVYDGQLNCYYETFDDSVSVIAKGRQTGEPKRFGEVYDDWYADATGSWIGKGCDSLCVCGPYITTKDEIGNPYDLNVYTKTNGVQRDKSSTAGYMIGVERIIHFFSSFMTLHPGDILHMGTVGTDGVAVDCEYMNFGVDGTIGAEIEKCGEISAHVYYPEKFSDNRSDEQKKIPLIPAVQDKIDAGDTEVDRFDCSHIQSVWTCFGNFKTADEVLGYKRAGSPRMLNGPYGAVTDKQDEDLVLAPIAQNIEVSCELAFVVKKIGKKITKENFHDYILGYAPVLSVCDMSIKNQIIEPATPQESSIGFTYGRWGNGYQTIGEVKDMDIEGRKMTLTVEGIGSVETNTDEYEHLAPRTIEYLSQATTVLAGDVFCLGRTSKVINVPVEAYKNGIKITAEIEGFAPVTRVIKPFTK